MIASFLWKIHGSKHKKFLKKKKCAPRGWTQRKIFPNAKWTRMFCMDLIKEQLMKHLFDLNVEIDPKP